VEFGNPFVEIGRTQSAKDGIFCLKTHEGYAQLLVAESKEHRLLGMESKGLRNGGAFTIVLKPEDPSVICRGSSRISSQDDDHIVSGTKKILLSLLSSPGAIPTSINEYRARGIISKKEYSSFTNCKLLLEGNAPQLGIEWADESIQFENLAQPIYFKSRIESKN
jgi:hypothetical protein